MQPNTVLACALEEPWFVSARLRNLDYVHREPRDTLPLSIKCRFGGASRYTTSAGDYLVDDYGCLLLNSGRTYAFRTPVVRPTYSFNVFYPRDWIASVLGSEEPLHVHETYYRYSAGFASTVVELMRGYQDGADVEETSIELLGHILATQQRYARQADSLHCIRRSTRLRLAARLHRARDRIYAGFQADLTLDDVARDSALSKFCLVRYYRELFGLTPMRDRTRKRMEIAQTLLRTDLDVPDIADRVGYRNNAAFITAFRRSTGTTPGRYRADALPIVAD